MTKSKNEPAPEPAANGPKAPQSEWGLPPPAGLDAQKHAKAQRAAAKGESIRDGFVAAHMATALAMGGQYDPADFQAYLESMKADLGDTADPIQAILIEQLAFAHLRLARLHVDATSAKSMEAHKILNAACSRLMGEIRRTALTLDVLRGKAPSTSRLKLAQTG